MSDGRAMIGVMIERKRRDRNKIELNSRGYPQAHG